MSDPVTNDYSSVSTLTPAEQRSAVLTLATLNGRARKSNKGDASFVDILDMLDLTGSAWQILGRPKPASPTLGGARDSYGRLRFDPKPAPVLTPSEPPPTPPRPVSAPATGKPAHNRRCAHDLTIGSPHAYVHPATGRVKCKTCRQDRERERRAAAKQKRAALPVADPNLCKCPGTKHRLHTAPNGRRYCPVRNAARARDARAKATAKRERWKNARKGEAA